MSSFLAVSRCLGSFCLPASCFQRVVSLLKVIHSGCWKPSDDVHTGDSWKEEERHVKQKKNEHSKTHIQSYLCFLRRLFSHSVEPEERPVNLSRGPGAGNLFTSSCKLQNGGKVCTVQLLRKKRKWFLRDNEHL